MTKHTPPAALAWLFLAAAALAEPKDAPNSAALYRDYTAAGFRMIQAAGREIDESNFREKLLSAAIFQETDPLTPRHRPSPGARRVSGAAR